MKNPVRLLLCLSVFFALATVGRAQTVAPKPGYTVVVEISYDETGKPEVGTVIQSDDPTGERMVEQIAMNMASKDVQPPRLVDGKPVKFKARRPFSFPVEGDKGEAANANRPVLASGPKARPEFPETLAAQNISGGAVIEVVIRQDGTVRSVRTVRASHPEFAQSAEAALRQWSFVPRDGPGMPIESTWNVVVGFSKDSKDLDLKWRLAPRPSIGSFIVVRPPPAPVVPPAENPAEKK